MAQICQTVTTWVTQSILAPVDLLTSGSANSNKNANPNGGRLGHGYAGLFGFLFVL